jgi:excisionase family DNA binding protein
MLVHKETLHALHWTVKGGVLMSDEVLISVEEAARRLGVCRSFLYPRVLRGEIPSVKLGRSRRVPVAALEKYVGKLEEEQGEGAR